MHTQTNKQTPTFNGPSYTRFDDILMVVVVVAVVCVGSCDKSMAGYIIVTHFNFWLFFLCFKRAWSFIFSFGNWIVRFKLLDKWNENISKTCTTHEANFFFLSFHHQFTQSFFIGKKKADKRDYLIVINKRSNSMVMMMIMKTYFFMEKFLQCIIHSFIHWILWFGFSNEKLIPKIDTRFRWKWWT